MSEIFPLTFTFNLLGDEWGKPTIIHLLVGEERELGAILGCTKGVFAVVHGTLEGISLPPKYIVAVLPKPGSA